MVNSTPPPLPTLQRKSCSWSSPSYFYLMLVGLVTRVGRWSILWYFDKDSVLSRYSKTVSWECSLHKGSCLYRFTIATKANYHKICGLKHRKLQLLLIILKIRNLQLTGETVFFLQEGENPFLWLFHFLEEFLATGCLLRFQYSLL